MGFSVKSLKTERTTDVPEEKKKLVNAEPVVGTAQMMSKVLEKGRHISVSFEQIYYSQSYHAVSSLDKKFDEMTTELPQSPTRKPWYRRWF